MQIQTARRERRVLARVCRAAWRLEQAGRERAWALASARAEGVRSVLCGAWLVRKVYLSAAPVHGGSMRFVGLILMLLFLCTSKGC